MQIEDSNKLYYKNLGIGKVEFPTEQIIIDGKEEELITNSRLQDILKSYQPLETVASVPKEEILDSNGQIISIKTELRLEWDFTTFTENSTHNDINDIISSISEQTGISPSKIIVTEIKEGSTIFVLEIQGANEYQKFEKKVLDLNDPLVLKSNINELEDSIIKPDFFSITEVVLLGTNQTIDGEKTFLTRIKAQDGIEGELYGVVREPTQNSIETLEGVTTLGNSNETLNILSSGTTVEKDLEIRGDLQINGDLFVETITGDLDGTVLTKEQNTITKLEGVTTLGTENQVLDINSNIRFHGNATFTNVPDGVLSESYVRNSLSGEDGILFSSDTGVIKVDNNIIATKQYADSISQGLVVKDSVFVATTENIELDGTNSPSQIDGVDISENIRVLVKNQDSLVENGVYISSTEPWKRAIDFDEPYEITGAFVYVENGATQKGYGFVQTNANLTVDVNDIIFTQFSSTSNISTGNGLEHSNNVISLETASTNNLGGIKVGSNLQIDINGVLSSTDTTYNVATHDVDGLMSKDHKNKLDGIEANANDYVLPTASADSLGGIKVGDGLNINETDGTLSTNIQLATQTVDGLMSKEHKNKLDSIQENAEVNVPADWNATQGNVGHIANKPTIPSGNQIIDWTKDQTENIHASNYTNTTYNVVTYDVDGLMSKDHKNKLDGIEANANDYVLPTATGNTLGGIKVGDGLNINETDGTLSTNIQLATQTVDGLMSKEHKNKLDSIQENAEVNVPADWNAPQGNVGHIANKPTIPSGNQIIDWTKDQTETIHSSNYTNTTYNVATVTENGLMSAGDKTKLDGIEENANDYVLPIANSITLGGVKKGANISIDSDGIISADYTLASGDKFGLTQRNFTPELENKLNSITTIGTNYTLPIASDSELGGIKVGHNLQIDNDGILSSQDTTYQLASTETVGLTQRNFTAELENKLNSITNSGNIQSDWEQTDQNSGSFIQNKPVIPTGNQIIDWTIEQTGNIHVSNYTNTTYNLVEQGEDGLMSITDKNKLDRIINTGSGSIITSMERAKLLEHSNKLNGIDSNANNYTLSQASADSLGGIKVGDGLNINETDGTLSTNIQLATQTVDGLLSTADKTKLDNNVVTVSDSQIITGDKTFTALTNFGKIQFKNVYESMNLLPDANEYQGMFAHVNSTGKAYFAHQGSWIELANSNELNTFNTEDFTETTKQIAINDTKWALKSYVDSTSQGLNIKEHVRVASVDTITLNNSEIEVDGINLDINDRVLLKAQSNPVENGIYVYTASKILERALDFNTPEKVKGAFTFVTEGTFANKWFVQTTTDISQIDQDMINFMLFSTTVQSDVGDILNIATPTVLGGIKVGTNLQIDINGVLSSTDTTYNLAGQGDDGLMSTADKNKLDGIQENAEVNVPADWNAPQGNVGHIANKPTIPSGNQIIDWTKDQTETIHASNYTNTTYNVATVTENGLMSTGDKTKLDGIQENAEVNVPADWNAPQGNVGHIANKPTIPSGNQIIDWTKDQTETIHASNYTNTTYNVATVTENGLMSTGDKTKLDSIEENANDYVLPIANSITLGGVKKGANISIDSYGIISADYPLASGDKFGLTERNFTTELNDKLSNNIVTLSETQEISGAKTFSNPITLNGGVTTLTESSHLVTKEYVDSKVQGLDIKDSVRLATTTNIILSSQDITDITDITLSAGDRILVKDQSNSRENGIYVYTEQSTFKRADDFDVNGDLKGAFTFVEEGQYAGKGFVQISTNTSDAINFTQFSGAGHIEAGDGISKDGNTLSIDTGFGLEINNNKLQIDNTIPLEHTDNTWTGSNKFTQDILVDGDVKFYGEAASVSSLSGHTTTSLPEGINEYYSPAKIFDMFFTTATSIFGRNFENHFVVRLASTSNISLTNFETGFSNSSSGPYLDGELLKENDLILVKDQSNPLENGIYKVNINDLSRVSNFATGTYNDTIVLVTEGIQYQYATFVLEPITIGYDDINFKPFLGKDLLNLQNSHAGQITAGSGLTKNGDELNVNFGTSTSTTPGEVVNCSDIRLSDSRAASSIAVTTENGFVKTIDGNGTISIIENISSNDLEYKFKYFVKIATENNLNNYNIETQTIVLDEQDIAQYGYPSISNGDNILVKEQTNKRENGIYIYNDNILTISPAWQLIQGILVFVEQGTFAGESFIQVGWPITPGQSDPGADFVIFGDENSDKTGLISEKEIFYTPWERLRLFQTEDFAQKNVKADWNETDENSDAFIQNKPIVPNVESIIDWTVANTGTIHTTNYTDTTYSVADEITNGLLSSQDKTKLNLITDTGSGSIISTTERTKLATNVITISENQTITGTKTFSQPITLNSGPTEDNHATTKKYVDSTVQGLDIKDSVRLATTANIVLTSISSISNVTLSNGDRVLVKDQSDSKENGIYVYNSSNARLERAADFDITKDLKGAFTFVEEGQYAGKGFVHISTNTSDAINFAQFSEAGQIEAGDGISKVGNTLSVDFGYTNTKACVGNDSRLSNARPSSSISTTSNGFVRTINGNGTISINQLVSNDIPDNAANTIGNAGSATKLETAINIGGVSFDGSTDINLPGVNTLGDQDTTGNAATVTDGVYTTSNQTITGIKTFSNPIILEDQPTEDNHAATKKYVDSTVQGLDIKDSVRLATTANIDLTSIPSISECNSF